jgi:hypothetical protein
VISYYHRRLQNQLWWECHHQWQLTTKIEKRLRWALRTACDRSECSSVSKLIFDLFSHRKREEYVLDSFPTRIRPPPLYISEDNGRLKNTTLNHLFHLFIQVLPFFQPSWWSLHLFMRFIGVLGGLADPRETLGMHLPDGSSREVFLAFCGEGLALDRPNRPLDWFHRSLSCLLHVIGWL